MEKETNLDAVKIIAQSLLFTDIHETKFFPMIVQHPFTNTGIVGINKNGQIACLNIAESEDDRKEWHEFMKNKIHNAKDVWSIYSYLNKPYALTFINLSEAYLSEKDFAELLAAAWINSENPNMDTNIPKSKFVAMFKKADKHHLMSSEDYEVFAHLDNNVTVYRGVTSFNSSNVKALSWTLDYDVAQWFAERFGENGTVYQAQIDKAHIFAYFGGRNESEIIVDPKYLTDITETESMDSSFDITM